MQILPICRKLRYPAAGWGTPPMRNEGVSMTNVPSFGRSVRPSLRSRRRMSPHLMRVVVADIDAFERFIIDRLCNLDGVASIESSFALSQVKYTNVLPLE
ncbi:MAG: Lrp/AsnC ligand binding domain-containing protein [Hyphomicrobiales bacterium]|nr:Lrp/AsnC ligand binding domain-containing protein [Hyphomicrobiales bacterium]